MAVDDDEALAEYFDNEAAAQFRHPKVGRREALRDELIASLGAGSQVIDVGAGPGRDGRAFVDAGCRYVGVDLSVGNARLAAAHQMVVVPGSLFELPNATSQRSHARFRSMLEPFGRVESFETWEAHTDWDYQFVVLRDVSPSRAGQRSGVAASVTVGS